MVGITARRSARLAKADERTRCQRPRLERSVLGLFAQKFQLATFRSAQAELHIPAYRRKLGDEARPQYRLTRLSGGSAVLTVATEDGRDISNLAVTRHLDALRHYERTGAWPLAMYQGELQAWGDFYTSILGGHERATVEVRASGEPLRIDRVRATALIDAAPEPEYRRVTCIGELHMIEVAKKPKFRINTEETDLVFDLPEDALLIVDPLRWRRVRAEAIWQVGTNRARLAGTLEPSNEPAGITVEEDVTYPAWVNDQLERIAGFQTLRAGWSSARSAAVRRGAIEPGQELTRRIYAQFANLIPPGSSPYFFPTDEGNVEFEWQVGPRFLMSEVVPAGYEILASQGKESLYEGTVNHAALFDWIRWLLTGENRPQ